jgi:predicted dienelactone hydrolase
MLKFIDQLQEVTANPTNPLHNKLDFNNMGAAGHSRGAKIAAMHFAGRIEML